MSWAHVLFFGMLIANTLLFLSTQRDLHAARRLNREAKKLLNESRRLDAAAAALHERTRAAYRRACALHGVPCELDEPVVH